MYTILPICCQLTIFLPKPTTYRNAQFDFCQRCYIYYVHKKPQLLLILYPVVCFSAEMPSRNRRPSVISDDEFGEQTLAIVKRIKRATCERIYESLDISDMSKDEVWIRLDSMCEAGLLDRQETKSGETLFKAIVDKKNKKSSKNETKKKPKKSEEKDDESEQSRQEPEEPVARLDAGQVEFYVEKTRGPVTKALASPEKEESKDHELTVLSKNDPTQVFHTRDYIRLIRYIISHMQDHGEPQGGISQIDKVRLQ